MIIGKKDNLDEIAAIAVRERAAGNDTFEFLVEPKKQVARFLYLWEGVIGRVVGRAYYEEPSGFDRNVDIVEARTVQYVQVRVRTTDVIEAARRAAVRGERVRAEPLRVNQIAPASAGPITVR